jgi:hypothetical protein
MQVLNVKAKLSNSGEAIRANKYQVNKVICLWTLGKLGCMVITLLDLVILSQASFNILFIKKKEEGATTLRELGNYLN